MFLLYARPDILSFIEIWLKYKTKFIKYRQHLFRFVSLLFAKLMNIFFFWSLSKNIKFFEYA
jgi:hypothetical protein